MTSRAWVGTCSSASALVSSRSLSSDAAMASSASPKARGRSPALTASSPSTRAKIADGPGSEQWGDLGRLVETPLLCECTGCICECARAVTRANDLSGDRYGVGGCARAHRRAAGDPKARAPAETQMGSRVRHRWPRASGPARRAPPPRPPSADAPDTGSLIVRVTLADASLVLRRPAGLRPGCAPRQGPPASGRDWRIVNVRCKVACKWSTVSASAALPPCTSASAIRVSRVTVSSPLPSAAICRASAVASAENPAAPNRAAPRSRSFSRVAPSPIADTVAMPSDMAA